MKKDWRDTILMKLMWLCWFTILVWLVAKTMGYINTPLWLEYLPLYSALVGAALFFLQSGKFLQTFEYLVKDVSILKKEVKKNTSLIQKLTFRMNSVENRLTTIEAKI